MFSNVLGLIIPILFPGTFLSEKQKTKNRIFFRSKTERVKEFGGGEVEKKLFCFTTDRHEPEFSNFSSNPIIIWKSNIVFAEFDLLQISQKKLKY